jgi:iron only hydrogenase large subunit-like protein
MFDKIYTTEELTKILEIEQMACVNGQRTFPMPDNAEEIAKQTSLGSILGAQRLFEVGCYHEFRDQVQKYQIENNISGLEVDVCIIGDKLYRFPRPIHQLELTKDD